MIGRILGAFQTLCHILCSVCALVTVLCRSSWSVPCSLPFCCGCHVSHSLLLYDEPTAMLAGGISTSLLFSAFESWVVGEHLSRGFDPKWLGDTFSKVPLLAMAGVFATLLCYAGVTLFACLAMLSLFTFLA